MHLLRIRSTVECITLRQNKSTHQMGSKCLNVSNVLNVEVNEDKSSDFFGWHSIVSTYFKNETNIHQNLSTFMPSRKAESRNDLYFW